MGLKDTITAIATGVKMLKLVTTSDFNHTPHKVGSFGLCFEESSWPFDLMVIYLCLFKSNDSSHLNPNSRTSVFLLLCSSGLGFRILIRWWWCDWSRSIDGESGATEAEGRMGFHKCVNWVILGVRLGVDHVNCLILIDEKALSFLGFEILVSNSDVFPLIQALRFLHFKILSNYR